MAKKKKAKSNAGRKSRYPGKLRGSPIVTAVTPEALATATHQAELLSVSRSDLFVAFLNGDLCLCPGHPKGNTIPKGSTIPKRDEEAA